MHCHVPAHVMCGMMGSLLVVEEGRLALSLPVGKMAPDGGMVDLNGGLATVHVGYPSFDPQMLSVGPGTTVQWMNDDDMARTATATPAPPTSRLDAHGEGSHTFPDAGVFLCHCAIHSKMSRTIMVT
jgi:plastocyanin